MADICNLTLHTRVPLGEGRSVPWQIYVTSHYTPSSVRRGEVGTVADICNLTLHTRVPLGEGRSVPWQIYVTSHYTPVFR